MITLRNILLIILVAVIFGLLMGFRAGLSFGWSRALIAALAFIVLGGLVSFFGARRR